MSKPIHKETAGLCVIGAGLPRTGTMSLMYALEILLEGKCHHGMKAYIHEKEWCDILQGKYSNEEFKSFLMSHNYVAAVDSPFCFHYDLAMKLFPDAKVVLTVREPNSWVNSLKETALIPTYYSYIPVYIFSNLFPNYLNSWANDESLKGWSGKLLESARCNERISRQLKALDNGKGADFFQEWINEVEVIVPPERLLKFSVKEGWGPLCEHLGLPIPDVPFPKVNNKAVFSSYLLRNRRRAWLLLYEVISIPLLSYGVYKLTH